MATINRINGLVSGFDTESLVKDLMKLEKTKTNKVLRDKQTVTWQKDAYKEMMSLFRGFQSDFLDVLKPGTNMRSKSAFAAFSATAKLDGADTTKVSVSTSSSSVSGTITIGSITLATKDTYTSSGEVKSLEGTAVDIAALNTEIAAGNNTIRVTVDGVTKSIDLAASYAAFRDADPGTTDLVTDLQSKLDAVFGSGKVSVGGTDGVNKLSLDSVGSVVTISTGDANVLGLMGFTSGDSNVLGTSQSLASAFQLAADTTIQINGKSIELKTTDSVQGMMQKINGSGAGVSLSYSTLKNGFTLTSGSEGFANNMTFDAAAQTFLENSLLLTGAGHTAGQDAQFTVNGVATTRSSNSVTVDGTTIQLKGETTTASDIVIQINPNTAPVKDNIVKFVNKYNELIEKVYGKLNEVRYRDYTPLVDEEKAEMSEDNIKLWEDKAKSGLIKGDSILSTMMTNLRNAFNETVSGAGITLSEMGITTSSNYKDNGKLIIDEGKLDAALSSKSAEIAEFFTKESDHAYGETGTSGTRYSENGLAARINDILNDNIRITRDSNGMKGLLVEKAGYEKASSDTTSDLAKKITALEDRYSILLEKMNDMEDRYYAKFTAMESALSKMNAQSSNLASMMGSSS